MINNILNTEELKVYNLVKNYTKKKPFIKIEEILPFLRNRLRFNPNFTVYRIEIILKKLIKNHLILPKTKFTKEDVLALPKREKIYNYILLNPSVNINKIIKNLKIGSNEALWHLSFLERFQFIRSTTIQNQKIFFKFDLYKKYDKIFYFLRNEKIQKMITLLANYNEPLKLTSISKLTKLHYNTAKKYMEILKKMKLIKITLKNKRITYTLNQQYYRELLHQIEIKQKEML